MSQRQSKRSLNKASTASAAQVWSPDIVENVVRFLCPNEVACTIRLVDKATSLQFGHYTTVRLSDPSPHVAFKNRWGVPGAMRSLTLRQRQQIVCLTAASGSLPNLEVAFERAGYVLTVSTTDDALTDVLAAAAAAERLEVCQWLRQRDCPWGNSLAAAAQAGHKVVCKWLLDNGCPWDDEAIYAAARGGHVGLMEWLMERKPGHVCSSSLLTAVAEGCDLATLKQLHSKLCRGRGGGDFDDCAIMVGAAGSPTADWQAKFEWLDKMDYESSVEICSEAASQPDAVDRLRWLRQRGYEADVYAFTRPPALAT